MAEEQTTKLEVKSLRDTLTQANYQNEMMLRWVNGAVVTVDLEGLVISANEVALQDLGWDHEELIGRQLHDTIQHTQEDGSEYPWYFSPIFAAIEDGSSHHVNGDIFWKKEGSSFSADYIVCPTRSDLGVTTGALIIFRNITQQKLEENKRIHNMKLLAVGELSAGIAHEINTPIQFIGNNLSFLKESFDEIFELINGYRDLINALSEQRIAPTAIENIKALENQIDLEYLLEEVPTAFTQTSDGVNRVTELVLGLKGFAHSGNSDTKSDADLNEVVKNSLIVCQNSYKHVADLHTEYGNIPTVKVYPGDIGQVVVNLIVNAADAIEEVHAESGQMGSLSITTSNDEEHVSIKVSDTGSGIPEHVKNRIFDPFFTTKQVGQGSGQGLAISHAIVSEKHQGQLTFESTQGEGTTFTIKLPL